MKIFRTARQRGVIAGLASAILTYLTAQTIIGGVTILQGLCLSIAGAVLMTGAAVWCARGEEK